MDVGQLHPVRWYRPGDNPATNGVPGTYRVDDEGRIEAHLHSNFDGKPSPLFGPDPDFPTLLQGWVMREGITLVNCRVTTNRGGPTDQCDTTFKAGYALEGYACLDPEELAFTDVRLRFTDQDVWTGWDRFTVTGHDQSRLTNVGAMLKEVPEVSAPLEGGTLKLIDGSYMHRDHNAHQWVLQSRSYFEFHFDEPVAIDEVFDRYAYPLQVMLMSASGRLPGVADMAGTNTAWDFGHKKESVLPTRWFSVRRFHGQPSPPGATDLKYLHRLADLNFGVQVPTLLKAVDTHRFALSHYGLLQADRLVGGNLARFGVATQLIDAFDRTLHPDDQTNRPLEGRLKRLEEESGNLIDGIIGNRRWRPEVAWLRNFVVHGDVNAHKLLRDERPLVFGYESLLLLFEARFLVELGFAADRAARLITDRVHHWTVETAIKENYPALELLAQRDRQGAQVAPTSSP